MNLWIFLKKILQSKQRGGLTGPPVNQIKTDKMNTTNLKNKVKAAVEAYNLLGDIVTIEEFRLINEACDAVYWSVYVAGRHQLVG